MILISQDRSTAYNFDTVRDIYVERNGIFATVDYEERRPLTSKLGAYETDERAKEVFSDLCSAVGEASIKPIGVVLIAEK